MEKSTLIQFIEKYQNSKLSNSRIETLINQEIDPEDFDRNKTELIYWFNSKRAKK